MLLLLLLLLLALVVLGIVVDPLDVPDKICPPFGFQLTEFAFVDFGQVDFPDVITKISEQREKEEKCWFREVQGGFIFKEFVHYLRLIGA